MNLEKAIWIYEIIKKKQKKIKKLFNAGSSAAKLRNTIQLHIDKYIFKNLREKNILVFHLDYKKDDGVDIQ